MTPRGGFWLPLLLCAVACSSAPPRRIYVLTPPTDPLAPTKTALEQRLEVRRLLVPDYLDSTDMLMRSDSNEVKASNTGRWGERLSVGLTRALLADLAARLPQYSIVQDDHTNPQQQLRITITALDLWPNGLCVLAANWSIGDRDSSTPVATGSGTFDSPRLGGAATATDASLVEAIDRTLGKLADSIVVDVPVTLGRADLLGAPTTLTAD